MAGSAIFTMVPSRLDMKVASEIEKMRRVRLSAVLPRVGVIDRCYW
jgi:hypothetical protein